MHPLSMALCLCSSTSFLGFRFAPGLSCVTYAGDKDKRACLQQDLKQESRFHVLLTTYEVSVFLQPELLTWDLRSCRILWDYI